MDPLGHMHLQEDHVRGKPPHTGFATLFFPIKVTADCLSQKDGTVSRTLPRTMVHKAFRKPSESITLNAYKQKY